jgi:hypothetical protein
MVFRFEVMSRQLAECLFAAGGMGPAFVFAELPLAFHAEIQPDVAGRKKIQRWQR